MRVLILVYTLVGLTLIGLAIPLIRTSVPPNSWYGFRVRATLNNPELWYPVNRRTGWFLLSTGVILTVLAAGLPFLMPLDRGRYSTILTGVLLFGSLSTLIFGWIHLRSLESDRSNGPPAAHELKR